MQFVPPFRRLVRRGPSPSLTVAACLVLAATVLTPADAVSGSRPTDLGALDATALPRQGSLPVGSASYAVPAGAIFVAISGSDSASGTKAHPLRTVTAALKKASSNGTIVLRAGNYHETVTTPATKTGITIQNYPLEAVWFDGSVALRKWTKSGTRWIATGWNHKFDSSASFSKGTNYPGMVEVGHPMAAHPDQVFVSGVSQRQVASASQVVKGTFHVDYATGRITLGTDPTNRAVRASDRAKAFNLIAPGTRLRGIGIRRFATPIPQMGAISAGANKQVLENLVIIDNASLGLAVWGDGVRANHLTVERSGLLGINVSTADGFVLENSRLRSNNSERFNDTPTSAGVKVGRTRNFRIANNDVSFNYAGGIWVDVSSVGMTIVNNKAVKNLTSQIEVEISDTGIIANNIATGGKQGIFVMDSGNLKIYNNNLGGSSVQQLLISQDARRPSNCPSCRDPRFSTPDPAIFLVRNLMVANNAFAAGGYFQTYALDKATYRPADVMNIDFRGNLFNPRLSKSLPTLVAWGGSDNTTLTRFDSVSSLRAKDGTWVNRQTSVTKTLTEMTADMTAAAAIAVPLPADVAAAIGRPAGSRAVGVFR